MYNNNVYEFLAHIDENILKELCEFLKLFYELRLSLCSDNMSTLHMVLPTKHKMLLLCEHNDTDSDIFSKLKDIYKINIEKYMKISEFHYISTLLYPPLRSLNNWLITNEKIVFTQK